MREHLSALSNARQGFYGHYTIAASADGLRAPLGTVAMKGYVHHDQADEETREFWSERFGEVEVESERWVEGFEAAEERLEGCSVIHVCDREADYDIGLRWLDDHRARFVIRAQHFHRKTTDGASIKEALAGAEFVTRRSVHLAKRSLQGVPFRSKTKPERAKRTALVSFRSVSVELAMREGEPIALQLVEALERRPPKGEEPVHWILLTSEPTDTPDELLRVVDIYRARWLIEDFFKAIKTGCAYSKRQLDSASTLLIALALTNPVAWLLLALRYLDRTDEELPASVLLNEVQLALLQDKASRLKWSAEPTVHEVLNGLAYIMGYGPSKGPPGWRVLGGGLQKVLEWEAGARMGAKIGLVIND